MIYQSSASRFDKSLGLRPGSRGMMIWECGWYNYPVGIRIGLMVRSYGYCIHFPLFSADTPVINCDRLMRSSHLIKLSSWMASRDHPIHQTSKFSIKSSSEMILFSDFSHLAWAQTTPNTVSCTVIHNNTYVHRFYIYNIYIHKYINMQCTYKIIQGYLLCIAKKFPGFQGPGHWVQQFSSAIPWRWWNEERAVVKSAVDSRVLMGIMVLMGI